MFHRRTSSAAAADVAACQFASTAARLASYRRATIERLTDGQPLLCRAAFAIRRRARGPSKLARRMRRRNELGRAGSL